MLYLHMLKIIATVGDLNKQYTVSQQSKTAKIFLSQAYYMHSLFPFTHFWARDKFSFCPSNGSPKVETQIS